MSCYGQESIHAMVEEADLQDMWRMCHQKHDDTHGTLTQGHLCTAGWTIFFQQKGEHKDAQD